MGLPGERSPSGRAHEKRRRPAGSTGPLFCPVTSTRPRLCPFTLAGLKFTFPGPSSGSAGPGSHFCRYPSPYRKNTFRGGTPPPCTFLFAPFPRPEAPIPVSCPGFLPGRRWREVPQRWGGLPQAPPPAPRLSGDPRPHTAEQLSLQPERRRCNAIVMSHNLSYNTIQHNITQRSNAADSAA